jgi:hypothetical protein
MRLSRNARSATVVACLLVLGGDEVPANDALDFWRQEYARQEQSRADHANNSQSEPPVRFIVRPRRKVQEGPAGYASERPTSKEGVQAGHAGYASERLYCVRTCDGFYFPLTARGGMSKAEMCRALCPTAPTEVYRLGAGDGSIEDATSERGKPYKSLPAALAYRKRLQPDCTCRGAGAVAMSVPITHDPTLARGDIVVTQKGVHVFAGGKVPHHERDFVHYRSYRGLSREVVTMLSLIDRPFRAAELKQTLDLGREPAAGAGGPRSARLREGRSL